MYKNVLITGGLGFIGQHFAECLLDKFNTIENLYLADLEIDHSVLRPALKTSDKLRLIRIDVREPATDWPKLPAIELIANFAAVHKDPGHEYHEYYETNVLCAENVKDYAELTFCKEIIFTSSISVYGPSREKIDEQSPQVPRTAYGNSKLIAEKIHESWFATGDERRLTIVRPGVVFGSGENGNMTRLVKAIRSGYFVFTSNQKTVKSGCYVKNLCDAMLFIHDSEQLGLKVVFNMSFSPMPCLADYVNTIKSVLGRKGSSLSIPYPVVFLTILCIQLLSRPFNLQHGINLARLKKITSSNNIDPKLLRETSWKAPYSLQDSFLDWNAEDSNTWLNR